MIDEDFVIGINEYICKQNNQESVILNSGMLSSAIGIQQWFDTIELQASAIFRSLILNHPFRDANKRTASLVLLSLVDVTLDDEELGKLALDIAKGNLIDPEEICNKLFPN